MLIIQSTCILISCSGVSSVVSSNVGGDGGSHCSDGDSSMCTTVLVSCGVS